MNAYAIRKEFGALLVCFVFLSAVAQRAQAMEGYFVLGKEYSGPTVACMTLEEAKAYVGILITNDKEKIQDHLMDTENTCYSGSTKFRMEKVATVYSSAHQSVTVTEGKIFGYYAFGSVFRAFEEPTIAYFIVGSPVVAFDAPPSSGGRI